MAEDDNNALQAADERYRRLLYVVSHDLRAPVRAITAFSELLGEADADDVSRAEYLRFIREGGMRLQGMLDDLTELSRIETRGVDPRAVPAAKCLDRALAGVEEALSARGGTVDIGDLPDVTVDAAQASRLFEVVLDNAIKFTERPPRITVAATRSGDRQVFDIADNGMGIAERDREHVFTPFARLHPEDTYPGRGIGLALARSIVLRHGGQIRALPRDPGTIIRFDLPAAS